MIGPGAPIDTDRFFVVCPNVLGGCQGTTGPASDAGDGRPYGSRFPRITIRDQVVVEAALADRLGIDRVVRRDRRVDGRHARARVGGRVPGASRTGRGRGRRRARDRRADRAVQRADPRDRGGPELAGRRLLRRRAGRRPARRACRSRGASGRSRYRSELEFDARFGREHQGDERPLEGGRYAVESYLEYHGEKLDERFDANTYRVLSDGDEPPRRRPRAGRHRAGARPHHRPT